MEQDQCGLIHACWKEHVQCVRCKMADFESIASRFVCKIGDYTMTLDFAHSP